MALKFYLSLLVFATILNEIQGSSWWRPTFNYTINNELEKPYFKESITLRLRWRKPLIYYMEQAVLQEPSRFWNFTATFTPIFKGFFIDAINDQFGFWKVNQTWWSISNADGLLKLGVSKYVPVRNDQILFNFTQGWIPH